VIGEQARGHDDAHASGVVRANAERRGWESGGRFNRLIARALAIVGGLCVIVVALWLIGRVCTDRWFWSQWLFWIPAPAVLAAAGLGALAALRPAPRSRARLNRFVRWAAAVVALAVYFLCVEHRFLHRAADVSSFPRNTLHIVHWNAQDPDADPQAVVAKLRQLNADVIFLTDINWMTWVALQKDPLQTGITPAYPFPLTLVSRVPILSVRPLVSRDLVSITLVELDTTATLGRALTVYMVDMPSSPLLGRAGLMRRARAWLEEATAPRAPPEADLVVGDFNTPRGSASIAMLFPEMREAFDEAGHGFGATYFRPFPLYHIDHILLGANVRALRYDIFDPGFGRHRGQDAWIQSRD
jgi:hypothetical protein